MGGEHGAGAKEDPQRPDVTHVIRAEVPGVPGACGRGDA